MDTEKIGAVQKVRQKHQYDAVEDGAAQYAADATVLCHGCQVLPKCATELVEICFPAFLELSVAL